MNTEVKDIDSCIALQSVEVREKLELMCITISSAAPKAEEVISYGMPAFKYHGMLVYFANFKKHIGFYPTASGIAAFQKSYPFIKEQKDRYSFLTINLCH